MFVQKKQKVMTQRNLGEMGRETAGQDVPSPPPLYLQHRPHGDGLVQPVVGHGNDDPLGPGWAGAQAGPAEFS